MAVFSHALLVLAAIGGAASVIALAAVLVSDEAWARWKNARRGSRAASALRVVPLRTEVNPIPALYDSEVEYLESSGTQFVDTGLILSSDGFAYDVDFTSTSTATDTAILRADATCCRSTRLMATTRLRSAHLT